MMYKLNEEQRSGLTEGIKEGFFNQGITLTMRDAWLIELSVKSTLEGIYKINDMVEGE